MLNESTHCAFGCGFSANGTAAGMHALMEKHYDVDHAGGFEPTKTGRRKTSSPPRVLERGAFVHPRPGSKKGEWITSGMSCRTCGARERLGSMRWCEIVPRAKADGGPYLTPSSDADAIWYSCEAHAPTEAFAARTRELANFKPVEAPKSAPQPPAPRLPPARGEAALSEDADA